ncbi:hypothetical protein [Basilea psittacipulmonis]|uniref:Uncharacterized protein n=1 Tax=Basilea psittacipulmonis DSM 24701 TaxID=1072685 RepID=A0A077DFZ8_9BURK|nr:hypothetical protein [Basilea psittacipulmonis]AIL33086.1 hypothetical protein IX83_06985 [Basilea psittacipulmonis DSM 24701]
MWKYPPATNVHKALKHAVSLARTSETTVASSHETNTSLKNDENQYYQGDINPVEHTSFTETANKYGGG